MHEEATVSEKDCHSHEGLLDHKSFFKRLLDHAPFMLYRMSLVNGCYSYISPAALNLCGYSPREFYESSILLENIVHPDCRQDVNNQRSLLQKGEVPLPSELRIIHRSGEVKWVYQRQSLILNEVGQPVAVEGILIDITERKQAEEALRQSEGRFRALIQNSTDAIGIADENGVILYRSPTLQTDLGYEPRDDVGKSLFEYFCPEDLNTAREAFESLIKILGGMHRDEYRLCHRDGSRRFVECTFSNYLHDPAIQGIVFNYRDITRRKRMEEALRDSEEKLRNILASSPDAITVSELDGRIMDCNQAKVEMHDFSSKEELIGKSEFDLIALRDHKKAAAWMKQVLDHGRQRSVQYNLLTRNGHEFPAELSVGLIRDRLDKPTAFVSIAKDISQRKRVEQSLRESEEKYRTLFENAAVGVFLRGDTFLDCNKQACQLLGAAREDIIGHSPEDFSPLFQPDGRASVEADKERITAAVAGYPQFFNWRYIGKTGTPIDTEVMLTALRVGGQPVVLATVLDVTERNRTEEALHELSGRLLQLQDEERRRIARDLHDTTAQWLAGLDMNLSLLQKTALELDPGAAKLVADSLEIVGKCVQEVRTLSHLLHPPLLDELGLVGAIDEFTTEFAKRSGVLLNLELPSSVSGLAKDIELALFRILQESLSNVRRHSGSPTVTVRLTSNDRIVTLEVRDKGRGMDLPGIKSPKGGASRKVGVGIAGMRERVRQLGGNLKIDSSRHGTTVRATVGIKGEKS